MVDSEEGEEYFEHFKCTVDANQELLRIDKFLIDKTQGTSRNRLQKAIKDGNVFVNEKVVKANYKVRPNDEILLVMSYEKEHFELIAENIPLNIVYEDEHFLIINKNAGLVVHPGHGNKSGTLVNALMYHFEQLPSQEGNADRPGLVHRLDKNTTGLMVIAKSDLALHHLSKQFFDRRNERSYYALVWGDLENDTGTIEGNIGRHLKNRKLMNVFPDGDYGKPAITRYEVLERFGYVTLVKCKLESGRTHQIRVHFKYIGHVLFGDVEYEGNKILKGTSFAKYKQFVNNCFKILPRQALHAKELGIYHPATEEFLKFESELPDDLAAVLDKWRNYVKHR